jgi:hypothetical protein
MSDNQTTEKMYVRVNGVRRQRLALIDIPQLSEKELDAVIRFGSDENKQIAWNVRSEANARVRAWQSMRASL